MENKMDFNNIGYVWAPYTIVTIKTTINGETVWYRNKFKNFLLKIKFLIIKPNYLKHMDQYKNRTINPNYYKVINIGD